jgi:hypothetical protein
MHVKVLVPHLPTKWDAATDQRIPSVNLNPAAEFGKITVLFDDLVPFTNAQPAVDSVIEKIETVMNADDLLLCVGDPILAAAALAAASRRFGIIRVMRWDKSELKYEVVEVSFE